MQQGNLTAALTEYETEKTITERLAKADPGNAGWQHALAVSYGRLAFVYLRLSNVADALAALRKGRDIMTGLVAIEPSNARWKQDLAWVDDQIAKAEGRAREAGKN